MSFSRSCSFSFPFSPLAQDSAEGDESNLELELEFFSGKTQFSLWYLSRECFSVKGEDEDEDEEDDEDEGF